jgi:hypothetical protein
MFDKNTNTSRDILSQTLSGITIVILITASYALFMFWTTINNYQSAVNLTSSIENRLLNVQSELNRQAQSWNYSRFGQLDRTKQQLVWSKFLRQLLNNQNAAIAVYAGMHSTSPARPYLGKFLALYGDIAKQYEYQKQVLEVGDAISYTSRQKMRALVQKANVYLDRSVEIMHGRISTLTSDNKVYINNGSAASVISFSLALSVLIFLSAGLYYRQRIL